MTRYALITRPDAEAAALKQRLAERGIASDAAPMLDIRLHRLPDRQMREALAGVTALLFTSANGVRAFCANSDRRDLAVFAVGEASAEAAAAAGFTEITAAGGDVQSLAEVVQDEHPPRKGALLHAAGTTLAGDLQAMLQRNGHDVRRVTLYAAEPAGTLPGPVAARFGAGGYDAALFFSPRTAATFVSLSRASGITAGAAACAALCLSANVAAALEALPWRDVRVAARPREAELLALLQGPAITEGS